MAATASGVLPALLSVARTELLPFDGRLGMAWRVAAQCMIAAAVFMTYGIPMAAIGCYLILFIMKPASTESSLMAVAISILVSLVVMIMFAVLHWTIDSPLLRMAVLVGGSILFLYIGAASQLGPVGNILAMVVAFIMTLLSDVPFGEVATRGLLYAWLMAAAPMGLVVLFNLFFGRSSLAWLRARLSARLQAAADVIEGRSPSAALEEFLLEGNEELDKQAGLVRLLHLAPTVQTRFLTNAISTSYRLMLAASRLEPSDTSPCRMRLAARCREAALAMRQGVPAPADIGGTEGDAGLDDVRKALASLSSGTAPARGHAPASRKGFFFADALSNPAYQHFALRTTAAAVICYLIYTALDWQGIHTAMITCYVAALGSTAETLHKLFLRIIGCLAGAAMGMASIIFVIPHITSIGALMILVFAGVLAAGWVAAGSERISYAGIQIGLAFLLTVLQGFGPDVQMDVAWDRIIGIMLGNFVMFVMFTKLWPVGMISSVVPALTRALNSLAAIATADRNDDPGTEEISGVMSELSQARQGLQFLLFEPRKLRPADGNVALLHDVISKANHLCRLVAFREGRQTSEYDRAIRELPDLMRTVRRANT
ncbi:FUSC family protein [Parapusillimonas granuli]|uniref:FUSC family protein n=1 Tax=Parapusillimonas granuli TaxID=380911 RepID=A0A853FZD2_9BURK|nr:FUSC family protein [Parapusillimonas granuli]MBB5215360.1 multidrug resistance protein MdtO [Parapusillimonas granuli]NYT49973.1 FUSC family protein [Parapusillimonas granuli]